jgi:hypothetical protein
MRPATADEIARLTSIDPAQPSPVIAHLLNNPLQGFYVEQREGGHEENLDDPMEAQEHEGEFFGLDVRTETIAEHRGYNVYARVRCRLPVSLLIAHIPHRTLMSSLSVTSA